VRATVALEEAVHETTHLVLERRDLTERLPTNQSCHFSSFHRLYPCARIKPECSDVKSLVTVGSKPDDRGRGQPEGTLLHPGRRLEQGRGARRPRPRRCAQTAPAGPRRAPPPARPHARDDLPKAVDEDAGLLRGRDLPAG